MAMGAYNLKEFVEIAESWGLTDVMLPFLLIFVTFFAILTKARIFGEKKKNLCMVLSLAVALTVVILHVTDRLPGDKDIVDLMNETLPNVSIVIVAILGFLIIVGIFGANAKMEGIGGSGLAVFFCIFLYIAFAIADVPLIFVIILIIIMLALIFGRSTEVKAGNMMAGFVTVLAFGVIFFMYGNAAGWFHGMPWWLEDSRAQAAVVITLVWGSLIGLVFRAGRKE